MNQRKTLLNPNRLKEDLTTLPIKIVDGVSYRTFSTTSRHVNSGMCQCFKDCDCAEDKGKVTITKTTWYRNIDFDGTDKCFYSEPHTPKVI